MDVVLKGKAALIIVNWEYDGFSNLEFPESDGEMMNEMLVNSEFDPVKVVRNSDDILTEIDIFVEEMNDKALEMFHFHYSGHGVFNAKHEAHMGNYTRYFEGDAAHTTYQAKDDIISGDCLVGTKGKLFPVEVIKRKVLELTSDRWTLTIDMCRGLSMRGGPREKVHIEIPTLEPVPEHLEGKIAVIYGTTDLHLASDYHSFTKELHKIVTSESCSISFANIAKKVNQSWAQKNIKQKCKEDIVHIGDNWDSFLWPSQVVMRKRTRSEILPEETPLFEAIDCMEFIFTTPIVLGRLNEKSKVFLVKKMIQDSRIYFTQDKASLSFSNTMKDLFDLLEQLEHGVYPSVGALDLVLTGVKNEFMASTANFKKYVNLTKISLFCKLMKICLNEEGGKKEVKDVSKLPQNLKLLVGKTIKTTLEDLDLFSTARNIVGSENQEFVDQIDWIKRVSHAFLTKAEYKIADFAFQHGNQVYKIWRLMKEIVPEGKSDHLESSEMFYKDMKGHTVTVKICIHADHDGAWYVTVHEKKEGYRKSISEKSQIVKNPPSLIAVFKPSGSCTKTDSAIFIPYNDFIKNNLGSNQWVFCANKIRNDQEITFCVIFNGTIVAEDNLSIASPGIANDCPFVPALSPAGVTLLNVTRGLSYKEPRKHPSRISLAVGMMNFSDKKIFISQPFLTSGTIDIPWNKELEASSSEVFFSRKVDYSLKGSVGVTVFSIRNENGFHNMALYWDVPYDRMLYVNKIALIPLETTEEVTSEEAYYNSAVQSAINNARRALDSPVSKQLGDYLVSVDMGRSYRTRIQVVFVGLNDLKNCSIYGV
eukprot:GFUD01008269.1.p1 GENE.GFUD01008269.1~~GFUD01008269.1.p1  ORF type:complete len:818 (+),score=184.90 GFUD01008269.1:27-2480(+)